MAGITALNKMLRQRAAFGGIMGRDGRRQYGGGSDMGQVGTDGKQGGKGSNKGLSGPSKGGYQGGPKGGYGDADRDGPTDRNPYDKGKKEFKKIREEQKQKVIDNLKASEISSFEPNKAINYLPFIGGARNILGTPLTKAGKTRAAKRRMEYINSLPPEQKRAMIERLGLAEDDDYDENDMFDKRYDPNFNKDLTSIYGEGINTLSNDPLSYQGETPLYGMDAYDIINYDGEFLKRYGQDLTNTGGGNETLPYIPGPGDTGGEGEEEDTGPDYRFGTGQKEGLDVTLGRYFNQGGRVPRNMGGIMNAVPRQGYFLGKIVKGVGKAIGSVADAAGKVLKSDVGKMALLAGGAYMLGGAQFMGGKGMFTSGQGLSRFGNIGRKLLLKDGMNFGDKGALSLSKILGLSAALPFIPGINKAPENEDIGMTARGGRLIDPLTGEEGTPASMRANIENAKIEAGGDPIKLAALNQKYNNMLFTTKPYENYATYAQGGRIKAQEGGLMNLGGMEKDYRAEGGFVPIGKQEKADDVPARLSVNEFVFTADAVRNAGGGDIDKGAEVMENMMKNLENGGRVSEESQGNTGAQEMFSVSERIGEVI